MSNLLSFLILFFFYNRRAVYSSLSNAIEHSDRILPLTLPVEIVQMLYTERVISKETLDEINRLGGVLGDSPLRALCTTVSEDPGKLKMFLKFNVSK